MHLIERISEIVEKLPYDLRAEVVIADMVERGLDRDTILVSSRGLFARKFSRDIEQISELDTGPKHQYALVEVNREGIYDALPQAVTHAVKHKPKHAFKTGSEMAEEVKLRRKEENAARKFFLPFENEFYQQRVNLELEERNILKGFLSSSKYTMLLNRFWQLPDILDARQKATFLYLVPIIYKVVGNLELTNLCYEAILNTPVSIVTTNGRKYKGVESCAMNKGKLIVGSNFVLGDGFYGEKQSLNINLGPLNETQLNDYLPDGKGFNILDFLNGYFMPFDLEIEVRVANEKNAIQSFSPGHTLASILGYNSFL